MSSSSDDYNPCYVTATEEESIGSSLYADSFRSLDLPPGHYLHTKPSARQSVDEFEPSSISCRFYHDFSLVDDSDCETGSDTHLLMSRQQLRHLPEPISLKPPPAQDSRGERSRRRRSHFHVHRQSLWNDDFDPFMAALKNVKKGEGKGMAIGGRSHRRAWSGTELKESDHTKNVKDPKLMMKGERSLRWVNSMPRAGARSPSPVPKGVMYARHTRLVKMDREEEEEEEEDEVLMDGASCGCGSKREMIKHLMVSMKGGRREAEEEEEAAAEEEEKQQPKVSRRKRLMRRLSFNKSRNGDEEEKKRRASSGNVNGEIQIQMVRSKSSNLLGCNNKVYAG